MGYYQDVGVGLSAYSYCYDTPTQLPNTKCLDVTYRRFTYAC